MREKIRGAGEAEAVEVTTKAPSRDNNSTRSRQQKSPALQLSSSGVLSLRGRADEEIVEQKLSEKLMEGFLLLEKACPCCATPLVKQEESADLQQAVVEADARSQSDMSSTLQPIVTPIAGIPFCVTCQAHIVTNEVEAVALQERYAGKTVQGKIMVAVSNGGPSPNPTSYSGRSLRSQVSKKSLRSIKGKNANNSTHCGSTVGTETRDEVSTHQSGQSKQRGQQLLQQQQAQISPALLTMKDTIEMFRSESSLCAQQSVPDKLRSPMSRPSISNMSSPHVAGKHQDTPEQKRDNRLAPGFAIAHGGGDEIEIICAESTQWFSSQQDNDDDDDDDDDDVQEEEEVETSGLEDGAEPKQGEEEMTMSDEPKQNEEEMTMCDEDEDEDSLRVMTSQDGPFETEAVTVPELEPKKTQESSGHRSKHSTSSHRSKRSSKSDRSKQSNTSSRSKLSLPVQKVNDKEPGRECGEAKSREEMAKLDLGKEQQKEVVTPEKEARVHQASDNMVLSESRGQAPEIKVADESPKGKDVQESEIQMNDPAKEEVTAEPAKEANDLLDNVVDDHDDIHEISVDHEDLMVGSGEDLTTEGSHLVDQEHDDECWPSYEERKAVATKVLGVKIMQGYSLLEKQCPHCTMPLTEYKGSIDCFVCPVLEKKVAKAKQHRSILETEMSRVKLEIQLMEQRKTVQTNKNKLLEKTKKLGKTSSISSSSVASAKASSNSCDKKIKEDRTTEQAHTKPSSSSSHVIQEKKTTNENNNSGNKNVTVSQSTQTNEGDLHIVTSQSHITSKASNSSPAAHGNDYLRSPDASDGGTLRIITSQSNITLKASNSIPAAEGNTNMKSPNAGDGTKATPTSQISSKTEESTQSKTIVKAVNTMSTSNSSSNASNKSKTVVKAQSVLSATTAVSSVASHRSKVVVKANSLLSAATVASTQASSRSNVIRIDSLLSKTTMPCSPASAPSCNSKTVVKASSLAGALTAVSTKASDSPASAKSKTVVKASSLAGVPTAVSTKGSDDTDSACVNDVTEKASETETKSSVQGPPPVKSEDSMPTVSLDSGGVDKRKSPIQSSEPRTKDSGVSSSEKKSKVLSLRHSASTQLAGVTKNSTIAAPKSSPEGGPSLDSKEKGASEGSRSRPPSGRESRERGLPIRPVMALVKVTPQPAPAQRTRKKNAVTKTAISTRSTTPQSSPKESGHSEQKLHSAPQPSEDSSKFSSAHSDSTISTKSKISRFDQHVAVVEHDKEAEAEAKMKEKVNLAIGPKDIRSFNSDESSEKNLSIATPADPGNCMTAMLNAAIGTLSGEDDSIMPPTQHELHKLNLEEIRLLKEAIQAEKAMREKGIEQHTAETEEALIEAKDSHPKVKAQENDKGDKAKSAARKERAAAKEETTKSAEKGKESAKVSPKPSEEVHVKPEDTQVVKVGPGQTNKQEEVEPDTSTQQVEIDPETKLNKKKEKSVDIAPETTEDEKSAKSKKKSVDSAPETTEDEKSAKSKKKSVHSAPETTEDEKSPKSMKEESPEQSLPEKIGALAKAIAEADKTAIAEAESIVRSFAEDYHDDQSRSSSLEELRRQQWETLRSEGRAAMTRRSMTGWTVSSEFCRGKECASSPLVVKGSTKQCVVCGGTGTGYDGVYDLSEESESSKKENFASNETSSEAPVIRPPRFDFNTSINLQVVKPPPSSPLNEATETDTETESKTLSLIRPPRISGIIPPDSDSEECIPVTKLASLHLVKPPHRFPCNPTEIRMVAVTGQPDFTVVDGKEARGSIESKRTIVSKEIGKRMLQGWKLLNLTCPTCLMPLMIDGNDEHEICVVCGLVTEAIQSTGTVSTMQPTLSFKSTEDNDSSLPSPTSFTALVPMNDNLVVQKSETRQNEGIHRDSLSDSDSTQKPDETFAEVYHKESRKLPQRSPRKSSTESPRKSSKESPRKSSKKSHKKSSHRSSKEKTTNEITEASKKSLSEKPEASPRKSKKSTRKSSKDETANVTPGDTNVVANAPVEPPSALEMPEKSSPSPLDYLMEPGQDLTSIVHLAERIRHRANTPRGDPPAARGHNVVRKSMLEADAMKAGDVVVRFDVKDASPVAADDKACGPSPSMIKTFDCDPPKENLVSAEVARPFAAHKACGPSPSMATILYYDQPQDNADSAEAQLEKKPDAPSPQNRQESSTDTQRMEPPFHARSPSIDPESSMGEYNEQTQNEPMNYSSPIHARSPSIDPKSSVGEYNEQTHNEPMNYSSPIHARSPSIDPESSMGEYNEQTHNEPMNHSSLPQEIPHQQDILTLEIPEGFDVNDEAALRQLIAQAKLCRPSSKHDVHTSHVPQTEPDPNQYSLECLPKYNTPGETQSRMINQDARWSYHLPSPGLTASPPGSFHVDIDTMTQHSVPTMEGYHLPSPGISEASLPLKSPASYRPRSIAPEHTRSQLRPRITPESMDRPRPSSRSRASSRSRMSSVSLASDSSSFDYVHMFSQSQSARPSRIPMAPPGAYSSYRVEKKTPESPEIIVIGGPQSITLMDDLVSLGKSIAATSVANSISTAALDALLARIEQTKFELDAAGHDEDGVEKQEKIAGLLQELSSAAAQMEMLDDPSSASSHSSGARRFRES